MATLPVIIDAAQARAGAAQANAALDSVSRSANRADDSVGRLNQTFRSSSGRLRDSRGSFLAMGDGMSRASGAAGGLSGSLGGVQRSAATTGRSVNRLTADARGLRSELTGLFVGGLGAGLLIRQVSQLSDEYATLQNRLRQVTSGEEELASVTERLARISDNTRSSFSATGELYARIALSSKELGASQEQLLDFTESLNQAIILSGATAQEASAGLIQLSQGLALGTLQSEELRSVLEQLPAVADVIARGIGVTRGELRELGAQGQITSKIILQAFAESREELSERFGKTIPTIGQRVTQLSNTMVLAAGSADGLNEAIGNLVSQLTDGIRFLAGMDDSLEGSRARAQATGEAIAGLGIALGGLAILATGPIGVAVAAIGALALAFIEIRENVLDAADANRNYRDELEDVSSALEKAESAQNDYTKAVQDGNNSRAVNLAQVQIEELEASIESLRVAQGKYFRDVRNAPPNQIGFQVVQPTILELLELDPFPNEPLGGRPPSEPQVPIADLEAVAPGIGRRFNDQEFVGVGEALEILEEELAGATEQLGVAEDRFLAVGDAAGSATKTAREMFQEMKEGKNRVSELVEEMESELRLARATDEQRAVGTAILKAQSAARKDERELTEDEIRSITDLTKSLLSLEDAKRTNDAANQRSIEDAKRLSEGRRDLLASLDNEVNMLQARIGVVDKNNSEASKHLDLLRQQKELQDAVSAGLISSTEAEERLKVIEDLTDALHALEEAKKSNEAADKRAIEDAKKLSDARRELQESLAEETAQLEDRISIVGEDSDEAANQNELLRFQRELQDGVTKVLLDSAEAQQKLAERANLLETLTALEEAQKFADGLALSLTDAAGALLTGGDPSEVLDNLVQSLSQAVIEALVLKPLLDAIRGSASEGTGIGGLVSGLFGSAQGNVFSRGHVIPFDRGGIIDQQISFPLRNGVGVAGEGGVPEAIIPLARTQSGQLGVRLAGEQGPGGPPSPRTSSTTNNFSFYGVTDMDSFRRNRSRLESDFQRMNDGRS